MDAFRFLTQNLGQAFPLALETADPAYPMIHYFTHPSDEAGRRRRGLSPIARPGFPANTHTGSPENAAPRAGSTSPCRDPSRRKSPAPTSRRCTSRSETFPKANILGQPDRKADADGSFELLHRWRGARIENWLPTTDGSAASCSSARLSMRGDETATTTLTIERVGMDSPRPMPSANPHGQRRWTGLADFVSGFMRDWPEHSVGDLGRGGRSRQPAQCFPAERRAPTPRTTSQARPHGGAT